MAFRDFINNWANKIKARKIETTNEELKTAPNPWLQPFQYKKWELIGAAFKQSEFNTLKTNTNLLKNLFIAIQKTSQEL